MAECAARMGPGPRLHNTRNECIGPDVACKRDGDRYWAWRLRDRLREVEKLRVARVVLVASSAC